MATNRVALLLLAMALGVCTACSGNERSGDREELIAFIREPPNDRHKLLVAKPDGSSERPLSKRGEYVSGFTWRADGTRLSYHGWETLVDLKPDGTDRRALLRDALYHYVQGWSPDGRFLALNIGRVNMHTWGPGVALLPKNGGDLKHVGDILGQTAWSPDSSRLAYTDRGTWYDGPVTEEQSKKAGLYAIDIESRERTRLTHSGMAVDAYPAWFPDGRHLAFLRLGRYEEQDDLYLLTLDDGEVVRHATGAEEFAISPSGSRLAWSTRDGLFTSSLDASSTTRLTGQAATSLTWSPDGTTLAYIARDSPLGQGDIYTVSLEDRRVRRVTKSAANETGVKWRPD